jgi:hypothetical protein
MKGEGVLPDFLGSRENIQREIYQNRIMLGYGYERMDWGVDGRGSGKCVGENTQRAVIRFFFVEGMNTVCKRERVFIFFVE